MKRPLRSQRLRSQRRRSTGTLRFEQLEARQLFASDLVADISDLSDADVQLMAMSVDAAEPSTELLISATSVSSDVVRPWGADEIVNYYRNTQLGSWSLPTVAPVESQQQLVDVLKARATDYWSGLFGALLSDKLAPWTDLWTNIPATDDAVARPRPTGTSFSWVSGLGTGVQTLDGLEVSADGYLYANRGHQISVIDARDPTHLQTVSSIDVGTVWAPKLYIVGNRLITVGTVNQDYLPPGAVWSDLVYRPSSIVVPVQTQVQVFDITDKSQPELISTFQIEGSVTNSQLQDGRLLFSLSRAITLPAPQTVGEGDAERFETADEYLARVSDQLLSAYLPRYKQSAGDGAFDESASIGDWQDVAWLPSRISENTDIIQIDVTSDEPSILDSLSLPGIGAYTFQATGDSVYVPYNYEAYATIYRLHSTEDGQLQLDGSVEITGNVWGSKGLQEKDGVLRVVSSIGLAGAASEASLAYVTTIGEVEGVWQQLDSFNDFGKDQDVVGVAFDGDLAILTTGNQRQTSHDYALHVIDLSVPNSIRQLGQVNLSVSTPYLVRLDDSHWLAIGNQLVADQQRLTLSIIDVTDPTSPVVQDTWTEQQAESGQSSVSWWDVSESKITYDKASGILSLGLTSFQNEPHISRPMGSVLFAVDLDAEDPLRLLALIDHPEVIARDIVVGGYVVTVSANVATSHAIDDLGGTAIDQLLLPFDRSQTTYVSYFIQPGESATFSLLGRWSNEIYGIVSVETAGLIKVTATQDGLLKIDATETDPSAIGQQATVVVQYRDGQTGTFSISIGQPYFSVPSEPTPTVTTAPSDATASITAHLENEQGDTVTNPEVGDEVWIVVDVQDTRAVPLGVFGAYVNVEFLSDNMMIIGEPDHLNEFVNARAGAVSSSGIKGLGGFTTNLTPPGDGDSQTLARFKIRVTGDGPLAYTIAPAAGTGQEFLLFGESARLAEASIQSFDSTLSTRERTLGGSNAMDINADGLVTPLDILLAINHLNAQVDARAAIANASAPQVTTSSLNIDTLVATFDFDVDGNFSDEDIYFMIDAFNARSSALTNTSDTTALSSMARIAADESLIEWDIEDGVDDSLSPELRNDWDVL